MGADHVNTVHRFVGGATVAAVADLALDRAMAVAADAGARPYDDALALIADPSVDAVVIASHDSVHAEHVLAAVKAGKPVLCEKPLASTLVQAVEVVREIGAAGETLLSLGFMRRFDPGYVELRDAIDRGQIGAPVLVHNTSRGVSSGPGTTSESSITGAAIHEFDIVPWLLRSPVVEVSWTAPRCSSRVAGLQDPQLIHLRTADGVLSTVETFLNSSYGYVIRCEVVGETGTISLTEPARVVVETARTRSIGYAADWRPRFAEAYRLELQAWVDALVTGQPNPLTTAANGLTASALAEAVITSMHAGGRNVRVETP
jgi:myo-inositol 2-dehydrogenase/D-chiro-inositol 1-dehydrogenase